MTNNNRFNRRSFLGSVAGLSGVAALSSVPTLADEPATEENKPDSVYDSYPLLQNVSESSASVSWAINRPATGWVEWGTTPALGKIARNSEFGLNPYESEFLSARINGLAPNTTYYYRVATCAFNYKTAYDKTASDPEYTDVYSFTTTGANAEKASLYMMNDTHNTIPTIQAHIKRADELKTDFIFWDGDLSSDYMNAQRVKDAIANPNGAPYAAQRPLVFVPGNHDRRGQWVRNLDKCLTTWRQEDAEFDGLGYNAAFRQGPLAMITLDTGEDKPDWHPAWSGMANFEPYRERQAAWLARALARPEIQSAPYIVAFCHIPLVDPNPKANPGNLLEKFADYQWSCAQMWGPLFSKFGVQLLIAAHQHAFSYAEPTSERPWAQIVGGGPEMKRATSIYLEATQDEMKLTCEKLEDQSALGSWTFKPRV